MRSGPESAESECCGMDLNQGRGKWGGSPSDRTTGLVSNVTYMYMYKLTYNALQVQRVFETSNKRLPDIQQMVSCGRHVYIVYTC